MNRWAGPIAFVLAVTLGIVLVALVLHWVVSGRDLGAQAATSLSVALGALVGAVSSYLGHATAYPPHQNERHPMSDTTAPDPDDLDVDTTPSDTPTEDDTDTNDHPVVEHVEESVKSRVEEHRQGDADDDEGNETSTSS